MPEPNDAAVSRGSERLHLAHVEGLRAIAALVVYVNHAYAQTWYPSAGEYAPGSLSVFAYSLIAGHLAVSVFIVISGFCLALPVIDAGSTIRGGTVGFFKRRARRILPPYYAALALSLLLIVTVIGKPTGTLWDVPIQVNAVAVISHLLLLQDLFGTGKINYVFWSIAVEWHIYFLFPLLVLAARRFGIVRVTIGALLVGFALRLGFDGTRLERANPQYLGLFGLGMLSAYVVRAPAEAFARARAARVWPWLAAMALATVAGMCVHFGYHEPERHFVKLDLPAGILAAAILIHTSLRPSWLKSALTARGLVLLGTFSYSVYLMHAPLLQLLWQFVASPLELSPVWTFAFLMTVGAAVVILLSFGFFRLFEQPFMRSVRTAEIAPKRPTEVPVTS